MRQPGHQRDAQGIDRDVSGIRQDNAAGGGKVQAPPTLAMRAPPSLIADIGSTVTPPMPSEIAKPTPCRWARSNPHCGMQTHAASLLYIGATMNNDTDTKPRTRTVPR